MAAASSPFTGILGDFHRARVNAGQLVFTEFAEERHIVLRNHPATRLVTHPGLASCVFYSVGPSHR